MYIPLCATLFVAAIFDYLQHRIPNLISLSGWCIAPLANLYLDGMTGFQSSILGLGFILVLTFPLFVFGWMGAGDIKLMATVGAYVGLGWSPYVLFGIVLTGAVFALLMLGYHRLLAETASRIKTSVGISIVTKRMFYPGASDAGKTIVLPYAIPIMVGTLITLVILNKF